MSSGLDWLKLKVTKNLNASEAAFEELLDRENSPGNSNRQLLGAFLEREDQNDTLLLFYATEHQVIDGKTIHYHYFSPFLHNFLVQQLLPRSLPWNQFPLLRTLTNL